MSRTEVLIELSPTRLELAVVRAGVVEASRSERSAEADWGADFAARLTALAPRLASWTQELGLAGREATVVYSAPTAVAGVFGCPASAGALAAARAGVLSLGGVIDFPLEGNPHGTQRLACDIAEGGPTGTGPAQAHTLACADRDPTTAALVQWLHGAGLECRRLVPEPAMALGAAVASLRDAATCRAVVWIGEHTAVLAAGDARRLRFVRTLSVGVEGMVDALTRPLRAGSGEAGGALDRAGARRILWRCGIPEPDETLDPERGVTGQMVLPLLQPALQRLTLEIKQSLRFGLGDDARAGAPLHLAGPGARLANLSERLAQACGTAVVAPPVGPRGEPMSVECGPLHAALQGAADRINLLPGRAVERRTLRRTRLAVFAGLTLAAAVAAAQGLLAWTGVRAAEHELASLHVRAEAARQATALRDRALQATALVRSAAARAAQAAGPQADWAAVLVTLAELTPEQIRFASIDLNVTEEGPVAHLAGQVAGADDAAFAATVAKLTQALSGSPLVRSVRLGATGRTQVRGAPARRFEFTVSLVPLPARPTDVAAATDRAGEAAR